MIERVFIAGTGLIGASVGLALREAGFRGDGFEIVGTGPTEATLETARQMGAIDHWVPRADAQGEAARADLVLLAGPVLAIEDWMQRLAPVLSERTLVTDVGSTKAQIAALGAKLYNQPGRARFLAGHPMAGKESGGAALAEASLFRGAMWLFTPQAGVEASEIETEWRAWVMKFGARTMDLDPARHDELVAWVSHLPQMLSTALAALLEETFADAGARDQIAAIGGRALRETTRLGASPYSMWRDIALTNPEPIAATLHALEQKLAHLRENLRTPELKEEFRLANEFRERQQSS
ncbi:MAG TPA: prephenate dehydrogenase/arogenate dehydrogenase family protein [Acidobacteriaceae bacterium]|nr:prephenate dehydrogenase/arogenate dehydrogenase family protein [Acidobacteriaceae bacterium]